jgi:hypothetical protein
MFRQCVIVSPQSMLHEKNIMQRGDDGESESGAQKDDAGKGNPYPA